MAKKNNKTRQTIKYVVTDWLCALIAWTLFFFFRKYNEDLNIFEHYQQVFKDPNFIIGIIGVPIFWLILYTISGYYNNVFSKSRLKELSQTFFVTLVGVVGNVALFGQSKEDFDKYSLVTYTAMIGIGMFVTLFESRARYLYTFIPFFVMMSVKGYCEWYQWNKKRRNDLENKRKRQLL